jgi:hypothetical protein
MQACVTWRDLSAPLYLQGLETQSVNKLAGLNSLVSTTITINRRLEDKVEKANFLKDKAMTEKEVALREKVALEAEVKLLKEQLLAEQTRSQQRQSELNASNQVSVCPMCCVQQRYTASMLGVLCAC